MVPDHRRATGATDRGDGLDEGDMPCDLLHRLIAHLERQARGTVLSTVATGRPGAANSDGLALVTHGPGTYAQQPVPT